MESTELLTAQIKDEEHLKLLKVFHYVLAGVSALFSCMFLIHVCFGLAMINHQFFTTAQDSASPSFGWFMVGIGLVALFVGWIYSALNWYAGRCIGRRQKRLFVLVMAGINCGNMPLGLILGIFTFLVMLRPSVTPLFTSAVSRAALTKSAILQPPVELTANFDDEAMWKELEQKSAQQAAENAKKLASNETEGLSDAQTISLMQPEHQPEEKKG